MAIGGYKSRMAHYYILGGRKHNDLKNFKKLPKNHVSFFFFVIHYLGKKVIYSKGKKFI